jgi:hypothetical protein
MTPQNPLYESVEKARLALTAAGLDQRKPETDEEKQLIGDYVGLSMAASICQQKIDRAQPFKDLRQSIMFLLKHWIDMPMDDLDVDCPDDLFEDGKRDTAETVILNAKKHLEDQLAQMLFTAWMEDRLEVL